MKRRCRIDLGQEVNPKEKSRLERSSKRWSQVNKLKPESENPFLAVINPNQNKYGELDESPEELKKRLEGREFGNYTGYGNYRNLEGGDHESSSDKRLELLKPEWFQDKRVLDIGCHRGDVTYAIARQFKPQYIIGIDIDSQNIKMANKRIKDFTQDILDVCKDDSKELTRTSDQDYMVLYSYIHNGPIAMELLKSDEDPPTKLANENKFPNNIIFLEHNYVLARNELVDKQTACFQTIVCLSVTKWIHLNYRDEGLKRFLKRIYNHLEPGGLFVLEMQPFDNYRRSAKLSKRLRANYYTIKFKPEQIDDYLLSHEVGFREVLLAATTEHQHAGFRRPLKVYLK